MQDWQLPSRLMQSFKDYEIFRLENSDNGSKHVFGQRRYGNGSLGNTNNVEDTGN